MWITQLITWGATLIVIRYLTPADYGLFAMAAIFLAFAELISEFAGAAIVTKHDLSHAQIAQLNSLCVAFGGVAFAISSLAAYPSSVFFRAPELVWVLVATGSSFLIQGFAIVPLSLLTRELQFKSLALMRGIKGVVQASLMVILAVLGFGYWTLVIGGLLGVTLFASLVVLKRPHSFAWPHPRLIEDALAFSWHVLVTRISWYVQTHADFLVAGRIVGQTALGVYSIGWTVASMPLEKITALVGRVTFPFFASVQQDVPALRRYFLHLTEGLALATFGAGLGLALVAEDFVQLVLGSKWAAAVFPLQILAVSTSFRAVDPLLFHILYVTGRSRFNMRYGIVAGILLPVSFYLGSRWGISGIAAMWLVVYPILTIPLYWRVLNDLRLTVREYLGALLPALQASLIMATTVLVIRMTLPTSMSLSLKLGSEIIGGAGVYLLSAMLIDGKQIRALYQLFRSVRS